MGLGRPGAARADMLGRWPCLVGLFSRVGLVCLVIGVGNTPVMLLLPACVGSGAWWVPSRVWGWHAVGVLGQCALVAWPVLLLPVGGGVWVWVGWL